VSEVSRTAIGVAWLRAKERVRPDRLFDDPYAADFVAGARDMMRPDAERAERTGGQAGDLGALFGTHVVVRTRFYDDYLLAATAAGCRQVVLVAAGLDARAFRLAWPDGVRLFELDLPDLLEYKERVLAARAAVPSCARTVLPVDLRADWAAPLVAAGFRPAEPTAWLVEGLLVYLSATDAVGLLGAIGRLSAPASQLACEHRDASSETLLDRVRETPSMANVLAMWKGELGDWLRRDGWLTRVHEGAALARSLGRADLESVQTNFLSAVRADVAAPTS
jgi:methyltransferase (TIGR00027 family)